MGNRKHIYLSPAVSTVEMKTREVLCLSGNSLEDWNVEEQDIFNN